MTVQLLHTLVLIGAAKSEPLITLELLTLLQVTWIAAHRASTTTFLSDPVTHFGCLSHKLRGRARWQYVYQIYLPQLIL